MKPNDPDNLYTITKNWKCEILLLLITIIYMFNVQ